ncbi:hypothetical protein [Flagellimonas oceanensis]|uniref:hypothetical protein n=1 Tax=Flagellimonas oceanensis TaxID=2499163 RepID=UPI003BAD37A6
MSKKRYLRRLVFAILSTISLAAQQPSDTEIYKKFDEIVGIQNTRLYQGVAFREKYRTINEKTQYFASPRFLKGSIRYAGQDYYGLDMKYDVYDDRILIKLVASVGGATLEAIPDWVDRFSIDGNRFRNIRQVDTKEINQYGFYKVSMEGEHLTLYTKYIKRRLSRMDREFIYYEFGQGKNSYVLHFNNRYLDIGSKKEFITLFPEYKKQIRKFYGQYRKRKNSDTEGFLISLTKFLDEQYVNTIKE